MLFSECCHTVTFSLSDINALGQEYRSFLGIWTQDGNSTTTGGAAQRPIYRKLDNPNLYLSSVEVRPSKDDKSFVSLWCTKILQGDSTYPLPWVMWGGPYYRPGMPNGNLKFGRRVQCPELLLVIIFSSLPAVIPKVFFFSSCCTCTIRQGKALRRSSQSSPFSNVEHI